MKILAIEKLRRIEQALTSLHARSYGICSRCSQEIPYARLRVQPDSLYCVPCLTVIEQGSAQKLILCRTPPPQCPHIGVQLHPPRAPGSPRLSLPASGRDNPRAATSLRRPPYKVSAKKTAPHFDLRSEGAFSHLAIRLSRATAPLVIIPKPVQSNVDRIIEQVIA